MSEQRSSGPEDFGDAPDDVLPELRPVPEGAPDPEEYEPVDPDPEAIVDGGTDVLAPDPDFDYPHAAGEDADDGPADGVEP